MNERIKELAKQAVNAVDNPFPGNPLNDELEKMYIPDCFAEKFAHLIIQECAEFARQHNLERAKRSHLIHKAIKEHFGVT